MRRWPSWLEAIHTGGVDGKPLLREVDPVTPCKTAAMIALGESPLAIAAEVAVMRVNAERIPDPMQRAAAIACCEQLATMLNNLERILTGEAELGRHKFVPTEVP